MIAHFQAKFLAEFLREDYGDGYWVLWKQFSYRFMFQKASLFPHLFVCFGYIMLSVAVPVPSFVKEYINALWKSVSK